MQKYIHLDLNYAHHQEKDEISVTVKLDDEGIVIDVWGSSDTDEPIATTYELYDELGVSVTEVVDEDSTMRDKCLYCAGDCPNDEDNCCDGYSGDIDNLYVWQDDSIQFPRLLAEIMATQENLDFTLLAESMDLDVAYIDELFDRANTAWEKAKKQV